MQTFNHMVSVDTGFDRIAGFFLLTVSVAPAVLPVASFTDLSYRVVILHFYFVCYTLLPYQSWSYILTECITKGQILC